MEPHIEKAKEILKDIEKELWNGYGVAWLLPTCKKCLGILTQKVASTKLVCLECGSEFEVVET